MKFTVIADDCTAYINTVPLRIDVSEIPDNVHALQYNLETNKGRIEFKMNEDEIRPDNLIIDNLPEWGNEILKKYQWEQLKGSKFF
jgi:hypothetical protein